MSYWRTLFRALLGKVVDPEFTDSERELIEAFATVGALTPSRMVRTCAILAVPNDFARNYWEVRNNREARKELEVRTRIQLPVVTPACHYWSKGDGNGNGRCNHPTRNDVCYFTPNTRPSCVDFKE